LTEALKKSKMPKVIFWAFLLNTIWEFTQCLFFYEMWNWEFWKSTFWMWGAVLGDILIVLGIWQGVKTFFKSTGLLQKTIIKYLLLLALSFGAGIFLEWMALYLELWEYDTSMPTLYVFNYKVGLTPILQITFLPALSVYLAENYQMSYIKHKNDT
tara:strand:- start:11501 stop:11968 length:468 start_codon:yes stop_codon:yes gene_type:complete